uniref:NADH-ubiquinone oxidoreductase chain 1 n=1 Tax=Bryopa lata TaxID=1969317 RepID=A0A1U9XPC7_9BIVA|nr:NADH dehydrogenase subunit 1 [Bryopa lata]AQZ26110.1 NADH dehydrogenase subunit 1 [Bryopa lata]
MYSCVVVSMFVTYVCVLMAVGYFTLFERKALACMQIRKGPNKVGVGGILQPIADAVKLLSKQYLVPSRANKLCFYFAPVFSFTLSLMLWHAFPFYYANYYVVFGLMYFFCVSSVSVFGTIMAGWASNSKYAMIGAIRGAAQAISYEVSFSLLALFCVFLRGGFSLSGVEFPGVALAFLAFPLFQMFLATMLAETNRAPFDLVEGESELVSGFNVEYSGVGFTLIFIAEYCSMLFMSVFVSVFWLGGFSAWFFSGPAVLVVKSLFVCFFFVLCRGALPRHRYDLLMSLTWKSFLPASLIGLLVTFWLS